MSGSRQLILQQISISEKFNNSILPFYTFQISTIYEISLARGKDPTHYKRICRWLENITKIFYENDLFRKFIYVKNISESKMHNRIFYFIASFETPPTWRARFPYLFPPGTGRPSYNLALDSLSVASYEL
jgi:hypothetical protein